MWAQGSLSTRLPGTQSVTTVRTRRGERTYLHGAVERQIVRARGSSSDGFDGFESRGRGRARCTKIKFCTARARAAAVAARLPELVRESRPVRRRISIRSCGRGRGRGRAGAWQVNQDLNVQTAEKLPSSPRRMKYRPN